MEKIQMEINISNKEEEFQLPNSIRKLIAYIDLYLEHGENTIYDIVHPEMWISKLIPFQNTVQQFNAYLTQITQKK